MTIPQLTRDPAIRRLRWVVLLVMLADFALTLIGQPPSYWRDPGNANEGAALVRFFLARGPSSYLFAGTLGIVGCLCLASLLPCKLSLPWLFYLLLNFGWGVTTWMTYEFHYDLRVVDAYVMAIAVLTAWALGKEKKAFDPTAAQPLIP
jgi:hypothetical protein